MCTDYFSCLPIVHIRRIRCNETKKLFKRCCFETGFLGFLLKEGAVNLDIENPGLKNGGCSFAFGTYV